MEFIRGEHNIKAQHYGCVASVGNYDGLHPGHQQVIQALVAYGKQINLPVTIVSFEPHPVEFFAPSSAPPRLMTVREKLEALHELRVDRFLCLRFNRELARTEPEEFIQNLLIDKLGVRIIVVGDDFRYGRMRRGDFKMLSSIGSQYGMEVYRTESFLEGGDRVSSTRIRESLAAGEIEQANRLLGRDYSISGRVVRGDGNGAKWGFATANIRLKYQNPALTGIFVVEVDFGDGTTVPAVASLGVRPTVGGKFFVLEVHILDFESNIYGRRIRVRFKRKLRDEVNFLSIDLMYHQIRQDVLHTREYFQHRSLDLVNSSQVSQNSTSSIN